MDDLSRFVLASAGLLALWAVVKLGPDLVRRPAMAEPTSIAMSARVRWWGVPVLYLSGLVFEAGLERASEWLDEAVNRWGWKITVRKI